MNTISVEAGSTKPPVLLGVNVDHCATVRQARYRKHPLDRGGVVEPDPVAIALEAQRAGADAITMHLREDRRHIVDSDVSRMKEMIQVPLNLEMAPTEAMVSIAQTVKPAIVLLVPEGRTEVTTEGGLDVITHRERVGEVIHAMQSAGISVSLFIDPISEQIDLSAELGATFVELHTGNFANVWGSPRQSTELERLKYGAIRAHEAGLIVNAGHGLNYTNIREARTIPWIHEMNIGHSIIARALFTGIQEAVKTMKQLMSL